VPTVLKSGSLNLLEPSGPVKACNWIILLLPLLLLSTDVTIPPLLHYHIHLDLPSLARKGAGTLKVSKQFPFGNQTAMDRKLLSRPFYQSLKGLIIALLGELSDFIWEGKSAVVMFSKVIARCLQETSSVWY